MLSSLSTPASETIATGEQSLLMRSRWFVLVRKLVEMLLEPALASAVMYVEIKQEPRSANSKQIGGSLSDHVHQSDPAYSVPSCDYQAI